MNTEILSQLVIPGSYANTLTYLGQIDSQNKHINRVQLIRGFSLALWYCYGLRTNLQSKKKRRWVVFRHLKIAAIQVTLACWTGLLDLLLFYYLLDSICLILLASGENFVCDVSPLHSTTRLHTTLSLLLFTSPLSVVLLAPFWWPEQTWGPQDNRQRNGFHLLTSLRQQQIPYDATHALYTQAFSMILV